MSNAEHLMENAMVNILENQPKESFFDNYQNKIMADQISVDLDIVYEMAMFALSWES